MIIFTKGYYSQVNVTGTSARPPIDPPRDPRNLTDDEKIALYEQWRPFTANSGTYEGKGSTLIRRAIVAKNVDAMTQDANIQEFTLEGPDTVWLIPIPSRAVVEPRVKLIRLE